MEISNLRIRKATKLIALIVLTILMVFGTCSCAKKTKSIDVSEYITIKNVQRDSDVPYNKPQEGDTAPDTQQDSNTTTDAQQDGSAAFDAPQTDNTFPDKPQDNNIVQGIEMDIDTDKVDELVDYKKVTKFVIANSDVIQATLNQAKELGRNIKEERIIEYYKTDFSQLIKFELAEDYQNLSNGDKVLVNIDVSDDVKNMGKTLEDVENELGITFKQNPIECTVVGIEEP